MRIILNRMEILYFQFEEDFVEDNVRCIPMIVRFKLDACGIKLKLAQWSRMSLEERNQLAVSPCNRTAEIETYRQMLQNIVRDRCHQDATPLEINNEPVWAQLNTVPQQLQARIDEFNISITLDQWKTLNTLQRFALIKLSTGGHEHKNLHKALVEFHLVSECMLPF